MRILFITLLFISTSASSIPYQIHEEDLNTIMPDLIHYFDITAYGGFDETPVLPKAYRKQDLLTLGNKKIYTAYFEWAMPKEANIWKIAVSTYFQEEDISLQDMVAFINQLDIEGKDTEICYAERVCHNNDNGYGQPYVWFDRRVGINPLAYKYHWATFLHISHEGRFFPKSLGWITHLKEITFSDIDLTELPAFVYSLLYLEVLKINTDNASELHTRFHSGMLKLHTLVLRNYLPTSDILTLPALEKLTAFPRSKLKSDAKNVVEQLSQKGVKHNF